MNRAPLSLAAQRAVTWIGLALLTASFVALLIITPPPEARPPTVAGKTREPFNVVILDAGHGGQDSGSMAGGLLEKDLTLDITQRVDRMLSEQRVATLLTRTGDSYVSLADRASFSNRADNAVFVSIHCNDGLKNDANGIETYFAAHQTNGSMPSWLPFLQQIVNPGPNLQSQSLAGFIQQEMIARTHEHDRGTKAEQFYVLANVRHPAVLVETGFLTNTEDVAKLADANYREQIASAITGGILKYRETLRNRVTVADAPAAP